MDHKREHRTPPLAKIMGVGRYQQTHNCPVQSVEAHGGEVMYLWSVCFRGEFGLPNCDYICMFVVNKQFELLEFVFDSVYGDLQYNEISLILLLVVCACVVSV